jgi:hypothetical protein
MFDNSHRYISALIVAAMGGLALAADAADDAPADKPRVVILCPECGMIYNIRRIEKPVAPERNLMPSITASPRAGGMGNDTQAVPLFSIGPSGAQRVQREPTIKSVWEVTVRYDNGQYGFVTFEMEPEMRVGDRVRHVENSFEAIPQPAR